MLHGQSTEGGQCYIVSQQKMVSVTVSQQKTVIVRTLQHTTLNGNCQRKSISRDLPDFK